MAMNNRMLRPLAALIKAFFMAAIGGQIITDQSGDPLRTIQNA